MSVPRSLSDAPCLVIEPCTDVVPVVVTHNPDGPTLVASLRALLRQVRAVIVVDNGSIASSDGWMRELALDGSERVRVLALERNLGLGEAYNAGISIARELGAAFVLLMDQDSVPEPGMVAMLRGAYADLVNRGRRVAAVGACYRDSESANVSRFVRVVRFGLARIGCEGDGFVRADFLISSGSLIAIATLDQVGTMDASLFIDHVDTEWCFRAQSEGFEVYGVCGAVMHHSLGDRRIRLWWGRWRTIPFHQPFRYYYMFRNSVLLWRRPYLPESWKRADRLRVLYFLLFYGAFSSNRIDNLRMMIKGLKDGYRGRTGKL